MATNNAVELLLQFASLQGHLVRKFLELYDPKDRERFRDVPNGALSLNDESWTHQRHGSGVAFVNSNNVQVNAHVAMADHPEGIDGGRLFEYLESLGCPFVVFSGREYSVTKDDMDRMVDDMVQSGLLRPVITPGRFSHRIFELRILDG
jgi:hypothetical protein